MRYSHFFSSCALALLLATGTQTAIAATAGQDNKLEWTQQESWQIDGKPVDMVRSLDGKYTFILNEQHQVLVYDQMGAIQGRIPVAAGVTAIDIAPQGESLYLIDKDASSFTALSVDFVLDIDTVGSPVRGAADAPVSMVVFTDFQCPYCIKLVPLLDEILEKNQGKVKIIFKNMPLQFHEMAEPAARAALAANEQGKFWEFHDKLFTTSQLNSDAITSIARGLGLDMARFENDMKSPEIRQKLNKDMLDAQKAGVTGTPTVYINGRKLKQRSPQGFQELIDDELKKAGK
jgi:protein-disulfide isomerase